MNRGPASRPWWGRLVPSRFVRTTSSESDVAPDNATAWSRAHGGPRPDTDVSDAATTTGTADNQLFVGRVAGDDLGYAGETGAEARSIEDNQPPRLERDEPGSEEPR